MSTDETVNLKFVENSPIEGVKNLTIKASNKKHAEEVLTKYFNKKVVIEASNCNIRYSDSIVYVGDDFYHANFLWGVLIS